MMIMPQVAEQCIHGISDIDHPFEEGQLFGHEELQQLGDDSVRKGMFSMELLGIWHTRSLAERKEPSESHKSYYLFDSSVTLAHSSKLWH